MSYPTQISWVPLCRSMDWRYVRPHRFASPEVVHPIEGQPNVPSPNSWFLAVANARDHYLNGHCATQGLTWPLTPVFFFVHARIGLLRLVLFVTVLSIPCHPFLFFVFSQKFIIHQEKFFGLALYENRISVDVGKDDSVEAVFLLPSQNGPPRYSEKMRNGFTAHQKLRIIEQA
jgi:hypothetical protein